MRHLLLITRTGKNKVCFFFLFLAESCIHLGFSSSGKATVGGERDTARSAAVGKPKAPSILHSEDGCNPGVPPLPGYRGGKQQTPPFPRVSLGLGGLHPTNPAPSDTEGKECWVTGTYRSGETGINGKTRNEHANGKEYAASKQRLLLEKCLG